MNELCLSKINTRKALIRLVCKKIRRGDALGAVKWLEMYNQYWRVN